MTNNIYEVAVPFSTGTIANIFSVESARCFTNVPHERIFLLPGLIAGTVGSIVSPGGAGKSMFSLMITYSLAAGIDLLELGLGDIPIKIGYFSAEDGADVLHERIHKIGKKLNIDEMDLCADNVTVLDATAAKPSADLLQSAWLELLEKSAVTMKLIFIDTLRSFHAGDENNSSQMSVLIGNLRAIAARTGCAIVFLHHTNKLSAMDGRGDIQQASRGSSVLTDNVRWQGFLSGMTKLEAEKYEIDEDRRGFFVRFGVSKQNYSAPIPDRWFRRVEGGLLESVTLVAEQGVKSKGKGGRIYEEV